ncbi:hypothetical protein AAMO2058_000552100 [Amorphochlora amoebiformis]
MGGMEEAGGGSLPFFGSGGGRRNPFGGGGGGGGRRNGKRSAPGMDIDAIDYKVNGPDVEYEAGMPVRLIGVAGRQNGKEGRVVGRSGGRYRVRLDSNQLVEVSSRNLHQIVEGASLTGLQQRPDLNGRVVRLVAFDINAGKYQGYLDNLSQPQLIRPGNIILPGETKVRIAGLVNRPEMNGAVATVVSYAREVGKYTISVAGRQMRIGLRNVFAA